MNRTLSEDADVLLTAATSADMIKLKQIKAVADGDPQGSPSLIFAPLINSFLNVQGEVSVMLTGVPLDVSDPENPIYGAIGQRGLELVLASGLVSGSVPDLEPVSDNHTGIVLRYQHVVDIGGSAEFKMEVVDDNYDTIVVADETSLLGYQDFSDLIHTLNATVLPEYNLELGLYIHSVTEAPLLVVVS